MTPRVRRTPLYGWHVDAGAEMTQFAGWEMPLQYASISAEHVAVREKVGLFDTSHMGRILVSGPGALKLIQYVSVNDIQRVPQLGVQYSCVCNSSGGVLDDVTVYRMADESCMIVCNAGNRAKILSWVGSSSRRSDARVEDVSDSVAMFALQGVKAERVAENALSISLNGLKPWRSVWHEFDYQRLLVSRTGYTGEDGFELYVWQNGGDIREKALEVWQRVLDVGKGEGIVPVGLGARDTLRLEAGFPLYGHELDESTTPIEARLDFVVKADKVGDYVGKEVLLGQKSGGASRVRIGFRMLERGVPRTEQELLCDDRVVGRVTSGTFSPLLKVGIGMGYVPPHLAEEGKRISVQVRGRCIPAQICKWPFYDPDRYGARRKMS